MKDDGTDEASWLRGVAGIIGVATGQPIGHAEEAIAAGRGYRTYADMRNDERDAGTKGSSFKLGAFASRLEAIGRGKPPAGLYDHVGTRFVARGYVVAGVDGRPFEHVADWEAHMTKLLRQWLGLTSEDIEAALRIGWLATGRSPVHDANAIWPPPASVAFDVDAFAEAIGMLGARLDRDAATSLARILTNRGYDVEDAFGDLVPLDYAPEEPQEASLRASTSQGMPQ